MSEFNSPNSEALSRCIRTEQIEIEEHLEQQFMADSLFHEDFTGSLAADATSQGEYLDELGRLQGEFLSDKKGKDMCERFVMALSDKYRGKVDVVGLGSTDQPSATNVDGLKHDYIKMLVWMQKNGFVDEELPRAKSGRFLELRSSIASPDHLIISRNRPLVKTAVELPDGRKLSLGVVKRMTFAMPNRTVAVLSTLGPENRSVLQKLNDEKAIDRLEFMLDEANGGIIPIRTGYYLSSRFK